MGTWPPHWRRPDSRASRGRLPPCRPSGNSRRARSSSPVPAEGGDPALRGESLRRAYGAAIKRAQEGGARTVAAMLPEGADADAISAVVEGLTLALYRFAQYKSSDDTSKEVESVALWSSGSIADGAVAHGQAIAAGVALARDLDQHDLERQDAAADRRLGAARGARVRPAVRGARREGARERAATTASSPSARGAPRRPG